MILKKKTKLNGYERKKDGEKEYEVDYKYIRWDGEYKEEKYLEKVYINSNKECPARRRLNWIKDDLNNLRLLNQVFLGILRTIILNLEAKSGGNLFH